MNFSIYKAIEFVRLNQDLFKTAANEATEFYRAIEAIVKAMNQPELIGATLDLESEFDLNPSLQAMALASVDFSTVDGVASASRIGVGSGFLKFLRKYWPLIVQILDLVEDLSE